MNASAYRNMSYELAVQVLSVHVYGQDVAHEERISAINRVKIRSWSKRVFRWSPLLSSTGAGQNRRRRGW
jgi:hypothetical protein